MEKLIDVLVAEFILDRWKCDRNRFFFFSFSAFDVDFLMLTIPKPPLASMPMLICFELFTLLYYTSTF